jgi:cellobiose-specific phosphotransferase system component IIB
MEQMMQEFRNQILNITSDQFTVTEADERIYLTTAYAEACIRFHEMNIVEFQITRKADDAVVFYLHFQLNDESHALYLLEQLRESLIHTGPVSEKRILMSCSSALTTSFFSEKLNQTAELLNLPFKFSAVSSDLIPEAGNACDMILLAPQIAHRKREFSRLFPGKPVLEIPGILFGAYDVQGIMELISRNLSETGFSPGTESAHILNSSRKIMAITTRIDSRFKISWRVFHHGKIIRSEMVVKEKIDYHDFEDILDTVSVLEDDIDSVVISVPGVVHDGTVILDRSGLHEYDMKGRLSQKYPYRFIITNNANTTALGLYHLQNDYHTVIYHSQLREADRAGQGIVIDGRIVTGKKGIAGEVNYLPGNTDPSLSLRERAERAVARAIIADIAIVGPDAVYIRCELLHSPDRVRELILESVSEEYIPDLFIIDHATEYMYYGAQMLASARD